jgi:hypothetical protein
MQPWQKYQYSILSFNHYLWWNSWIFDIVIEMLSYKIYYLLFFFFLSILEQISMSFFWIKILKNCHIVIKKSNSAILSVTYRNMQWYLWYNSKLNIDKATLFDQKTLCIDVIKVKRYQRGYNTQKRGDNARVKRKRTNHDLQSFTQKPKDLATRTLP